MTNLTAFGNQTSGNVEDSVPTWFAWTRATVYTIVTIFTLVINTISITVLRRLKSIHPVTRLLLISLNITDVCFALFAILPMVTFSVAGNWTGSLLVCALHSTLLEILPFIDLLILVVINGERVVACTRPLRYESIVTIPRVKAILLIYALFWTGFICIITPWTPTRLAETKEYARYDHRFASCTYDFSQNQFYIFVIYFSIAALLPILIIILMVIKLVHVAQSQARRITRELAQYGGNVHNQQTTNKGLHTFLLITISMAIVWVPISVVLICETAFAIRMSFIVIMISHTILFSFSWINVTIYYWRNQEFRNKAKAIFKSTSSPDGRTTHTLSIFSA